MYAYAYLISILVTISQMHKYGLSFEEGCLEVMTIVSG